MQTMRKPPCIIGDRGLDAGQHPRCTVTTPRSLTPHSCLFLLLLHCACLRSGYREETWPVPGTNSSLYFRGIRNLDASLDALFDNYGMDEAEFVILNGGSAGGLSTFLHLDHVQQRVTARSPAARVVGQPVCGFFLDHGNDGFAPANMTYPLQMQ